MEEWEKLGDRWLSGKDADAVRGLADSGEARRLREKISPARAEQALRSGDPEQVKALLRQILETPEGRALAERISALGGRP